MNRDERAELRKRMTALCLALRNAQGEAAAWLEETIDGEEAKIQNLPAQIREGARGQSMEQELDEIRMLLKAVEAVGDAIDEVEADAGVTVPSPAPAGPAPGRCARLSEGRKGVGFYAVIPRSINERMGQEAVLRGMSKTELVCQALVEYWS